MRQCKFQEVGNDAVTYAWIDSEHAKVGTKLDFNLGDGDRSPIVVVREVYDPEMPDEYVNDRGQDYKRTRKASDI